MGIKYFQIFGIQRSSTTFLTRIVGDNSLDTFVSADSKHMEPKSYEFIKTNLKNSLTKDWLKKNEELKKKIRLRLHDIFTLGKPIHPIVIIKNPYSWFLSVERWDKLENRWKETNFKKWFMRFNKNYEAWKDLLENPRTPFGKGTFCTYENLLRAPHDFLYTLRNDFGMKLKDEIIIRDRMASAGSKDPVKYFTEERKQFYLQDGDFGLSKKLIKQITGLVDWELMKFYGYKPKGGV